MLGCVVAALIALSSPQAPQPSIRLTGFDYERIVPRPNLLTNASFERLDERQFPVDWNWDKRNTDANCTVDESVAHSGKRSLKITNGTGFGPHIYGMLWRTNSVQVEPGKPYTVSAWFRSRYPGIVHLMGGSNWQFRARAPITGDEWRRVTMTFTPGDGDRDFVVRFGTESQTQGVWVDDVKLEEGAEPTPFVGDDGQTRGADLAATAAHTDVDGDGPFHIVYQAEIPDGAAVTLSASLAGSKIHADPLLQGGFWKITVLGESRAATDKANELIVELKAGKTRLAERSTVQIYSTSGAQERLAAIEARLPGLHAQVQALKRRKQDASYPLVTLTVLDNFVRYAREDIPNETRRALQQVGDMEGMVGRVAAQLRSGKPLPTVPVRVASVRTKVKDGSFLAPVRLPSGKIAQDWPVFLYGYGHFGQVVTDMEKWPGYGCNMIQIEFGPNSVFPKDGETSSEPMKRMRGILDRAQKAGVMVCLLVSPHYMPDWAFEKWPQLRKRREGFIPYCIHAPEGRDLLRRFLHLAIEPLKDHPALNSVCLSNEPVNVEEPCEYAAKSWHEWLAKTHGTIETLNQRWHATYASFDEVALPNPFGPRPASPLWMDYTRFNQEQFAGWHQMMADAIHDVAPRLPVHAKAMTWTLNEPSTVQYGVDPYLFGALGAISGNDSSNNYLYGDGLEGQSWTGNAISYDLQKSVAPGPVFNTENHLIPDRDARWVPAQHIRTALWQQAIHGQGASAIWVWERTFDRNSDFAGSIMHRPACAEAAGIVNHDLNRAAREVTAIQRAPFDVAILQSVSSLVWDGGAAADCAQKLYYGLTFDGFKAGFVTERQLEAGITPSARAILVPNVRHLSSRALAALAKLGNRLIYIGAADVLTRDSYDAVATPPTPSARLRYVYGKTGWTEFQDELPAILSRFGVAPLVTGREVGRSGHLGADFVEVRSGKLDGSTIADVVNYRSETVTVRLRDNGGDVRATDVLTGQRVSGTLTLAPLEFRLLRLDARRIQH